MSWSGDVNNACVASRNYAIEVHVDKVETCDSQLASVLPDNVCIINYATHAYQERCQSGREVAAWCRRASMACAGADSPTGRSARRWGSWRRASSRAYGAVYRRPTQTFFSNWEVVVVDVFERYFVRYWFETSKEKKKSFFCSEPQLAAEKWSNVWVGKQVCVGHQRWFFNNQVSVVHECWRRESRACWLAWFGLQMFLFVDFD